MSGPVSIGGRLVGYRQPTYIIAEIGINHNGDLGIAKKLIDAACRAGCDAVKFQKRSPDVCVPKEQRELVRDTPWGRMSYLDYRYRLEFGAQEYAAIDRYTKDKGIAWFASCWDEESVEFIETFDPVCHKVASACLSDDGLLSHINSTGRPVILSTGMSTMDQIRHAVTLLDRQRLLVAHSTSSYPCAPEELNLRMIETLRQTLGCPVGYSGHEEGLQTTSAAVALGACFVERHITLDRSMWGSDHEAALVPEELAQLVQDIRTTESALGDGSKKIYASEMPNLKKLRRVRQAGEDAGLDGH